MARHRCPSVLHMNGRTMQVHCTITLPPDEHYGVRHEARIRGIGQEPGRTNQEGERVTSDYVTDVYVSWD